MKTDAPALSRASEVQPPPVVTRGRSPQWLYACVLVQLLCQVLLLSSSIGPLRVVVRTAAFMISLALLAFVQGRGREHPAARPMYLVLGILALEVLHPDTSQLIVGFAQITLYFAILAPVFWVPRLAVPPSALEKLLSMLWLFHTASAAVGVLQAYFPGSFQPSLSIAYAGMPDELLEGLQIQLSSGAQIFRPMGLSDTPGAAATSGYYACLFGIGFFLDRQRVLYRILAGASMTAGMVCLYLCQVRSLVVMLGVSVTVIMLMLALRGKLLRVAAVGGLATAVVLIGFGIAVSLGGDAVVNRLATLTEASADEVYSQNRGLFLKQTVDELLPQFPLGAGLGRWGMTASYFGSGDSRSQPIWVEIQWTGWLLDGGVPLILAYAAAIVVTLWFALRFALRKVPPHLDSLWLWTVVLVGYDIGAIALTFNCSFFSGSSGLEFWILNSVVFACWTQLNSASAAPPVLSRGSGGR